MAGAGVATAKTTGVGAEKMALLGRHGGPFAVGDAAIRLEGRSFATQGQLGGRFAAQVPGVKQIQVRMVLGNVLRIGQAGRRVFRREACNVIRRLHRALNRGTRKIRGAGIATAVADVDRHPEGFVTVALHGLQRALAH